MDTQNPTDPAPLTCPHSRSYTVGILGVEGYVITVDADVDIGLPCWTIVGQVSGALDEARERVRAALGHCGHLISPRKQIVHLAPTEHRKDSPGCDLAIACALLGGHSVLSTDSLAGMMMWGELALDGTLRPAVGTLVVADTARQHGFRRLVVPEASAREAAMIPGIEILAVRDLASLVAQLRGEQAMSPWVDLLPSANVPCFEGGPDLSDIRGLALPRLALEIMIAGGHNLLLHGPPGVGKTMLARRIPSLLPPLEHEDALEVTKIHGVAHRQIPDLGLIHKPPVRMPHHTVSVAGLLGGGNPPRPGEVSLAHRGVLFLDELPEFPRACVDGLREPLEDGSVTIVRARYALHYPARFQLIAAMNPCPCGFLGHPERVCTDSPAAVQRYQSRVSGPFLDRMDLVVPVTALTHQELANTGPGESSAVVRERILVARARQRERLVDTPWANNAGIPSTRAAVEQLCPLTEDADKLLLELAHRRNLSTWASHRLRSVARTIQDLDHETNPRQPIAVEAVSLAARLRHLLRSE